MFEFIQRSGDEVGGGGPEAVVTLGFHWENSLAKWTGTARAHQNVQTQSPIGGSYSFILFISDKANNDLSKEG